MGAFHALIFYISILRMRCMHKSYAFQPNITTILSKVATTYISIGTVTAASMQPP